MQRLINSLLDIYRLEAGQPITDKRPLEISRLCYEAADAIQPVIEHKHQTLNLNLQSEYPRVVGDEDMIRRVIINLLENAPNTPPAAARSALSPRHQRLVADHRSG
jgi:signal transduction histidine kinase